ncbi:hypothetical protein, partial [Streptococcus himalayensis]|uniref:hypothetical protein n=1 Tax=Streptococcus himalayensis TaxID=1888195 RepID=UPI001E5F2E2C
ILLDIKKSPQKQVFLGLCLQSDSTRQGAIFYIKLTDLSYSNLVSKNGLAPRLSNNHLLIHQKYKQ